MKWPQDRNLQRFVLEMKIVVASGNEMEINLNLLQTMTWEEIAY